MKPNRSLILFLASSAVLAGANTAHAQKTWTGASSVNWTATNNWSPTGAPASGADVIFDGTGINLNTTFNGTARTLNSLTFTSGQTSAVTINTTNAAPLTLGPTTGNSTVLSVATGSHIFKGSNIDPLNTALYDFRFSGASGSTFTLNIAGSAVFEINGRIGANNGGTNGNRNYEKTGSGTLILSGNNGGSGGWNFSSGSTGFTISNGVLQFADTTAFGNSANVYTVNPSSGNQSAIELTGSKTQTVNNGRINLNGTGIGNNGALRSLSGNNTISGTGTGGISLASSTSIGVDADSLSIGVVVSNSGNFTKVGAGTLTLSGANTYTGTTTISAGAISAGNIVVSGGTSNMGNATSKVTLGSAGSQGTLSYTGNTATYTRGFTIGGAGGGRLDVTTAGQTLTVDTAGIDGNGLFTVGGVGNTTIKTALTHTGGLTKTGGGTLTLEGNNTFTGTTTVNEGKLIINGAHASTSLSIANGATLGGTGTIAAAVTISGVHSPGNSPGVQPFGGDLTYDTGGSVLWELVGNTTSGRGTSYDGINVGGALTFSVATPLTLDFTYTGSTVDWANPFWDSSYTGTNGWLLYSGATSLTNFSNLQISTSNWADGQGDLFNTELSGSSFSLFRSGNNIYLNYTAIPEPATTLLGGLGLLALLRRRRCREH